MQAHPAVVAIIQDMRRWKYGEYPEIQIRLPPADSVDLALVPNERKFHEVLLAYEGKRLLNLKFHQGVPVSARLETESNWGTRLVDIRFDKLGEDYGFGSGSR